LVYRSGELLNNVKRATAVVKRVAWQKFA